MFEFRDGKIAVERRLYDFTALLLQVGVLKASPGLVSRPVNKKNRVPACRHPVSIYRCRAGRLARARG